jgi:hypothetical protein
MTIDRIQLRLIRVEPRGLANEWTTLYIPADRYADAQEHLESVQAHANPSLRWRDCTPQERAWVVNQQSDGELNKEIAYSLLVIDDKLPAPLPVTRALSTRWGRLLWWRRRSVGAAWRRVHPRG